jgi:hypothetical protein
MNALPSVQIGTYSNASLMRDALKSNPDIQVGNWAWQILLEIIPRDSKRLLQPEALSVRDLGFSQGGLREKIYNIATLESLSRSPLELGPLLRLAYLDQPEGECLIIGALPFEIDDRGEFLFRLFRQGNVLWLDTYKVTKKKIWLPDELFVFARYV